MAAGKQSHGDPRDRGRRFREASVRSGTVAGSQSWEELAEEHFQQTAAGRSLEPWGTESRLEKLKLREYGAKGTHEPEGGLGRRQRSDQERL